MKNQNPNFPEETIIRHRIAAQAYCRARSTKREEVLRALTCRIGCKQRVRF